MKKFLVFFSLSLILVTTIPLSSDARAVLRSSRSGVDDLGCIWIEEVWEHHLFGICWYTTTKIYSPNCNQVLSN
jgi:hypothetical protein